MEKLICVLCFILIFSCSNDVKTNIGNNHVVIKSALAEKEIIRLAANIAPSERQLQWQQLEFTAFFHFGMNTFTDREWGKGDEDPKLFNPTALDARQWVKVCKEAGVKQVIITAKHHDGFCLWPSKYTEHSVKNSLWKGGKGDVVREVSDACREMGMGFGIYLSPWDRNSPYYGDSPKYNAYFMNQLTELLTNYGKVDEVWFDGACGEGPNGKKQVYDVDAFYSLIRKLQPGAVIAIAGPDVRWIGTESGYGRDTEWSVLPVEAQNPDEIAAHSQKDVNKVPNLDWGKQVLGDRPVIKAAKALVWFPAEADVSIRPGWFYHTANDSLVKTPERLVDIYFSSVGKNSGLLLNIPPDKRGLIHENDVKSLSGMRSILEKTFATNFVTGAKLSSDGIRVNSVLDNDKLTYWTTTGDKESGYILISLPKAQKIDVLSLQENIRIGQRIEKYTFEYQDDTKWKTVVEGTTIGYKRLLRFAPVTSREFRLKIEASRLNPTLSELGLYKLPVDSLRINMEH